MPERIVEREELERIDGRKVFHLDFESLEKRGINPLNSRISAFSANRAFNIQFIDPETGRTLIGEEAAQLAKEKRNISYYCPFAEEGDRIFFIIREGARDSVFALRFFTSEGWKLEHNELPAVVALGKKEQPLIALPMPDKQ